MVKTKNANSPFGEKNGVGIAFYFAYNLDIKIPQDT